MLTYDVEHTIKYGISPPSEVFKKNLTFKK